MTEDPDERIDLDTVDDETSLQFQEIMDLNQKMQNRATRRARKLWKVADSYDDAADTARQMAQMAVLTAQELAEAAADLLTAEFDIQIVEAPADDEFDDSDIEEEDDDDE